MNIYVRKPFVVYVFNDENKGSVFARFATFREAESFCQEWQARDPACLYAVSEDPL